MKKQRKSTLFDKMTFFFVAASTAETFHTLMYASMYIASKISTPYNPPSMYVGTATAVHTQLPPFKKIFPSLYILYFLWANFNQILPCLIKNKNRHNTVIIKPRIFQEEEEDSGKILAQNAHIFTISDVRDMNTIFGLKCCCRLERQHGLLQ